MTNMGANLKANFSIFAKGSQAVILGLVCGLILSLGASFWFLWFKPERCAPPFLCSAVLFVAIVVLWVLSHRDADGRLVTTSLVRREGHNVTKITTGVHPSDGMKLIERIFSVARLRRPLPEADGLIDEKGDPIPLSKTEANSRIASINIQVTEVADYVKSRIGTIDKEENLGRQRLTESEPHENVGGSDRRDA